jgi:hypothetical protein
MQHQVETRKVGNERDFWYDEWLKCVGSFLECFKRKVLNNLGDARNEKLSI